MSLEKELLLKARSKYEKEIRMYKEFLKGKSKTFDGKYGAEEFVALAQHRIEDIDLKLNKLI
tara:strand:+ start:1775 stop:1960 length:186 start_codon:yes stop_codon:yes gene_type:complete